MRELLVDTFVHLPPPRIIEQLTSDQAEQRLDGADHSIAEIVAHMSFWQDWFCTRCEGTPEPMGRGGGRLAGGRARCVAGRPRPLPRRPRARGHIGPAEGRGHVSRHRLPAARQLTRSVTSWCTSPSTTHVILGQVNPAAPVDGPLAAAVRQLDLVSRRVASACLRPRRRNARQSPPGGDGGCMWNDTPLTGRLGIRCPMVRGRSAAVSRRRRWSRRSPMPEAWARSARRG